MNFASNSVPNQNASSSPNANNANATSIGILERVAENFQKRFETICTSSKSYFAFAHQVAVYEIFCTLARQLAVKQMLSVEHAFQYLRQKDDFLMQTIGLTHLSEKYYICAPLTSADIRLFESFIMARFEGAFKTVNDSFFIVWNSSAASHPPTLVQFYEFRYQLDAALIKQCCQLVLHDASALERAAANEPHLLYQLRLKSEAARSRLARVYMSAFTERCFNERFQSEEEMLEQSLDLQIREKQFAIEQIRAKFAQKMAQNPRGQMKDKSQSVSKTVAKFGDMPGAETKTKPKEYNRQVVTVTKGPKFDTTGKYCRGCE